jgi:hypothetical protein
MTAYERIRAGLSTWPLLAVLVSFALFAFILTMALSGDFFVLSEARSYALLSHTELDAARFLIFPEPQWGHGRLTAMLFFEASGRVCGVDNICVNGTGAALVALAVAIAVVHARQVIGSTPTSVAVGALWLFSPVVLAVTMWQSTRFDTLAFILALSTSAFWWWLLGKARLSWMQVLLFGIGSICLMALAFNAKEITFYLLGALVILAVIRGYASRTVKRNLLLSAIPVAYAVFFIVYALLHIEAGYASNSSVALIPENLLQFGQEAFGLSRAYMGIWHSGPWIGQVQQIVSLGLLAVAGIGVVAGIMAIRGDSRRIDRQRVMDFGSEFYLVAIIGATVLAGARSDGSAAYYLLIPYWALLVLGARLLRRLSGAIPAGRMVATVLALVFAGSVMIAYAGLLGDRSAWRTLQDGSDRMHELGAVTRALLTDAPVRAVTWRTLERPDGHQYTLRGDGSTTVTGEIWPWLMNDAEARPVVTEVTEGDVDQLRADRSTYDEPGEILLVIDGDYRLRLLAQDGRILLDARGS